MKTFCNAKYFSPQCQISLHEQKIENSSVFAENGFVPTSSDTVIIYYFIVVERSETSLYVFPSSATCVSVVCALARSQRSAPISDLGEDAPYQIFIVSLRSTTMKQYLITMQIRRIWNKSMFIEERRIFYFLFIK